MELFQLDRHLRPRIRHRHVSRYSHHHLCHVRDRAAERKAYSITQGNDMKSTPEMRHRIRELATPERDDFDRAVLMTLDDLDQVIMERDEWQKKWLALAQAAMVLAPEAQ